LDEDENNKQVLKGGTNDECGALLSTQCTLSFPDDKKKHAKESVSLFRDPRLLALAGSLSLDLSDALFA
jgi:hypothetical protein